MEGCSSWLPFVGGGIADGVVSRSGGSGSKLQQKQDLPISSQPQVEDQRFQQFYLLMDMEKNGHPDVVPSPESSMFRSFPASPDETSSFMPRSSNNTTAAKSSHHQAEVSSQNMKLSGDGHYDHCYGNLDTILNLEEIRCQEAHTERAPHKNGHRAAGAGAFKPYVRHLSPKKKPKPGSGGQRAIKAAMTALARMHMVRLAQWQCYQKMEVAVAPPTGSNCNQLQHVLSERKRRERLNDSFKALKTVLPPASKKDKASILIRARDYVSTLKSRVSELEEKNRMLVDLQKHCNNDGDRDDDCGKKIVVDIDREAAEATSQEFHLKIVVGSECNAIDAVVSILEGLKEIGDVRLVAMDTGSRATTLTLQMKSRRWDDRNLKESVIKSVKGAMKSKIKTS